MVVFKARIVCDFDIDEHRLNPIEALGDALNELNKVVTKLQNVDYLIVKKVGDIREA